MVAVLTWGYVSSLILLFGAQLTAVCHREHPVEHSNSPKADEATDPPVAPSDNVVPLKSIGQRG